ncbi:type II toxin-antitoxin system RelE/ParE family toxin [Methylomonas paludis]|uniref:Type II toxin-antitoxin system RelE/ParE family toxin n=1 Tax=Methylomonas paludis TaxID=1173101 RepID=A0A975MQ67_9GAMM|nr:type II toxin-antitoxin system RelE/ParE family toxin [Methylomonas paludis]QWF71962.1 type II toxin-antitoxin system RelE/ParE family toxin [Methylomonas paludis]
MTQYRIEIKSKAKKELANLPKEVAGKIYSAILGLADNPRSSGCKKLVGSENSYRIRINNYRVVYSIFDQILLIQVVKIAHRQEVYKS